MCIRSRTRPRGMRIDTRLGRCQKPGLRQLRDEDDVHATARRLESLRDTIESPDLDRVWRLIEPLLSFEQGRGASTNGGAGDE